MRRSLIELPLIFSNKKQNDLLKYLEKQTGVTFVFDRKYQYYLIDNELFFIKTLCDFAPKQFNVNERINDIIGIELEYKDNVVYNYSGSFANIRLTIIDNKSFVVKIPTNSTENFSTEFNVMNSLYHNGGNQYLPYVANFNKEDGSYMEEAALDSLDNYVRTENIDSVKEKLEIIRQIIDDVSFIHSRGIVHRDLHSGNILKFANPDTSSNWKLVDFGLAYDLNNNIPCGSRRKGCYGSPEYISPHQRNHFDEVLFQNDIYSVGRLINFILTKSPYNDRHVLHQLSKKCCSNKPHEQYTNIQNLAKDFLQELNTMQL